MLATSAIARTSEEWETQEATAQGPRRTRLIAESQARCDGESAGLYGM